MLGRRGEDGHPRRARTAFAAGGTRAAGRAWQCVERRAGGWRVTNAGGAPQAGARGYLGGDGGGTKTHAVLVDESGHERGRGHAARANITAVGTETAVANILAAVRAAQPSAGPTPPLAGGPPVSAR